MPTVFRLIGVASEPIASVKDGFLLDILIQNLSANNVYVGSSQEVTAADGILMAPNGGVYVNDQRKEPVWLIAAGAASDVRIFYEIKKE